MDLIRRDRVLVNGGRHRVTRFESVRLKSTLRARNRLRKCTLSIMKMHFANYSRNQPRSDEQWIFFWLAPNFVFSSHVTWLFIRCTYVAQKSKRRIQPAADVLICRFVVSAAFRWKFPECARCFPGRYDQRRDGGVAAAVSAIWRHRCGNAANQLELRRRHRVFDSMGRSDGSLFWLQQRSTSAEGTLFDVHRCTWFARKSWPTFLLENQLTVAPRWLIANALNSRTALWSRELSSLFRGPVLCAENAHAEARYRNQVGLLRSLKFFSVFPLLCDVIKQNFVTDCSEVSSLNSWSLLIIYMVAKMG